MINTFNNTNPPENQTKKIIMCIGVGGGGCNIINHMHSQGIKDVILVAANTDEQALVASPVPTKIQLGPHTTHGLGAGADPEVGERAALESKEEIDKILTKSIKMVFLVGGEGGGTGTGALPVVASIAKEKDEEIVVVGVVTAPFDFEGVKKKKLAEEGIRKLKKHCDTLIIIENERLMDESNTAKNLSLREAFGLVDSVLYDVVTSITDPINEPSLINLDFHDVKTMLSRSGYAVIGRGVAEGEDRGKKAARQALNSTLVRHKNIKGCRRLIISVASGMESEIKLVEFSEITKTIRQEAGHDDLMVIWGHYYAKRLENKVQVSVIASGFLDETPAEKEETPTSTAPSPSVVDEPEQQNNAPDTETQDNETDTQDAAPAADTTSSQSFNATHESKSHNGIYRPHDNVHLHQKNQYWDPSSSQTQHLGEDENPKLTEAEIKELVKIPAYVRKNISLDYRLLTNGTPPVRHHLSNADDNPKP